MAITQDEAIKLANKLFKEQKPHAVIYGYQVKRGINAKEVHEFLDNPIVLKTAQDLDLFITRYLSKRTVTRDDPSRMTGVDVLYHELKEGLKNKTYKIR